MGRMGRGAPPEAAGANPGGKSGLERGFAMPAGGKRVPETRTPAWRGVPQPGGAPEGGAHLVRVQLRVLLAAQATEEGLGLPA